MILYYRVDHIHIYVDDSMYIYIDHTCVYIYIYIIYILQIRVLYISLFTRSLSLSCVTCFAQTRHLDAKHISETGGQVVEFPPW